MLTRDEVLAGPLPADVCLVLEGSYPFVRGGVAEWAHRLVTHLPERTFHIWSIIPGDRPMPQVYAMPRNVTGLSVVKLFAPFKPGSSAGDSSAILEGIEAFYAQQGTARTRADALFENLSHHLGRTRGQIPADVLFSPRAFDLLVELYQRRAPECSFLDFLYSALFTHLPIVRLLGEPIPPARIYHAVSTGYAGFLAARAHRSTGCPMLLTEHGIYTVEREIEILLADWIYSTPLAHISMIPESMNLKRLWIDIFRFLGRLAYEEAERIFTLFAGNASVQQRLGATREKLEIVPNGVDLERFRPATARAPGPPVVSLVGRVVAIKDIRTLIRACRIVHDRRPDVRFQVIGPTSEEPAYYEKCLSYRHLLGLDDVLTFRGEMDTVGVYAASDAVVLTSISEGLPLTLLEAMACGVPVVATRVGACPELVQGSTRDDRALGPSGLLVDVGDHREVGEAILTVLADPARARELGATGRRRVERYYDQRKVVARYGATYADRLARAPAEREVLEGAVG